MRDRLFLLTRSFSLFAAIALLFVLNPLGVESLVAARAQTAQGSSLRCSIVFTPSAPQLEKFAAGELRRYLYDLYGLQAPLTSLLGAEADLYLIVGSPATNPAVVTALGKTGWPQVSDQGLVLKKVVAQGKPALVLGGGSPEATLWAVYDFVERAGVRFLLEKDVLPEKPAPFPPVQLDVVREPALRFRSYRGVNDLATSLVFYGLKDYQHLIDQLAKMKFNAFYVQTYPQQPFVHYEFRGQKKTTGVLHYGWKLPIHAETIGKELFGGKAELVNPDLEGAETYEERIEAATRLLHGIFAYTKSRGMKSGLFFWINQFTDEFNRRLPEWSDREYVPKEAIKGARSARLGASEDGVDPIAFPYMTPNNPVVMELNRTLIRTHIDTYPEVDFYGLSQPEMPKSGEEYKEIWNRLNTKHHLEPQFNLASMLEAAQKNLLPVGVRVGQRPLQELKAAIAYADTVDRLLSEYKILEGTANPNAKILASTFSDEFYPVMGKIFGDKVMLQVQLDYLTSLAADRADVLSFAAQTPMKVLLMGTLADDNIGILPQLPTPSLYRLVQAMKKYGVYGFLGRQFLVTKLEAATAYLAQASWNSDLTPDDIYRDQVEHVCGEAAVPDMLRAYKIFEVASSKGDKVAMGFLFPVPTLMSKHWENKSGPVAGWDELVAYYRQAVPLVASAHAQSRPAGKSYLEQLLGQLNFSIEYVEAVQEVRRSRLAYDQAHKARQSKDPLGYGKNLAETHHRLEQALRHLRSALKSWAAAVRDPSDLGALAAFNAYGYDYLKGIAHAVYLESQIYVIHY